jgi:hypothetical protein
MGCVTLHLSSLRRTVGTPHSSRFTNLAFGTFYFAVPFLTSYEVITYELFQKGVNELPDFPLNGMLIP